MTGTEIRPLALEDGPWLARWMVDRWGGERVVVHGMVYRPAQLPGFVALRGAGRVGLVTYHIEGAGCEIVTLDSLRERQGIGSVLIKAVKGVAREAACERLWLITTNDNLHAIGFYQRRGFRLAAIHPGAVDEARRVKPQIPEIGMDGIPLRDEIELEMTL